MRNLSITLAINTTLTLMLISSVCSDLNGTTTISQEPPSTPSAHRVFTKNAPPLSSAELKYRGFDEPFSELSQLKRLRDLKNDNLVDNDVDENGIIESVNLEVLLANFEDNSEVDPVAIGQNKNGAHLPIKANSGSDRAIFSPKEGRTAAVRSSTERKGRRQRNNINPVEKYKVPSELTTTLKIADSKARKMTPDVRTKSKIKKRRPDASVNKPYKRLKKKRPDASVDKPHKELKKLGQENRALKVAEKGYVDTDLAFNEFFSSPHTIMGWVMPEFTYNYYGAIFAENGSGLFFVGQGNYRSGNGGHKTPGSPVRVRTEMRLIKYRVHFKIILYIHGV